MGAFDFLRGIRLPRIVLSANPSPETPAADEAVVYSANIAGRMMPKWMGPDGIDYPFQAAIGLNYVAIVSPGAGTGAPGTHGNTITTVGTASHPLAATNRKTSTRRTVMTSSATAGTLASIYVGASEVWRGNAAGMGGFFCVIRFGLTTLQSGNRAFFGLTDTATTAPTNIDPTSATTPAKIGMAINANSGNWKLVNNTSAAAPTVLDLGASFPVNTTDALELVLYCAPNASSISYRITNLSSGAKTSGTLYSNLPAATAFLGRTHWMTNNATAAAVAFDLIKSYMEADY